MFETSRKNTLTAASSTQNASVNTSWTAAMAGIHTSCALIRCGKNSTSSAKSGINPNTKLAIPANVDATGRTSFGKWICLMSRSWPTTDVIASYTLLVNHFQGRIAAKMKSG